MTVFIQNEEDQLEAALAELFIVKSEIKSTTKIKEDLQSAILELIMKDKKHKRTQEFEGTLLTSTVVKQTKVAIDEQRLKKEIGAVLWKKLSVQVLDMTKLEDAMSRGLVDPTIVANCSVEECGQPYIKQTIKGTLEPKEIVNIVSNRANKAIINKGGRAMTKRLVK